MRAKQEYVKWIHQERFVTADNALEEAYVAGFKRAVELAEEILKRQGESDENNVEEV